MLDSQTCKKNSDILIHMRYFRPVMILTIVLTITSCSLYRQYQEEIAYTIPAGEHYSTHAFFKYVTTDTTSFSFRFDETAVYDIGEEQSDINKLFGFAEGSASNIHKYSARFGWRYYHGVIEIMAYSYVDGERISEKLGEAFIGNNYSGTITSENDSYLFSYEGKTVEFMKEPAYYHRRKYLSYPYFGGNMTAPHDITVWVTLHEE